jgi:hypothetical protein
MFVDYEPVTLIGIIVSRTKMTALSSVLVTIFVGLLVLILRSTTKACVDDARRRGKSPLLVAVAVILFFPWGTIAWLLFRPEPLNPMGGQRQFRLEDYRVQ